MASIIPGFEYDIFISYRRKDNKHDGWVTDFVDNLKGELESTFKEEISVYFDINPHDGLLETHDVDESLKEKLRSLIFIPVISRTYCDPKSFAWEHEFKAFVETASHDQFGLKVKLPNGNVAGRILPVRIHDLDDADIKMFEEVTGSKMRTSDFIFSTTSGVNRPLKADEDHPYDNLNKTYYRDQINKVALAIKEIINALQLPESKGEGFSKERTEKVPVPLKKNNITKILTGSVIMLVLVILGYLFIPTLTKPSRQPERSIAVLPFINDSPDEANTYFINGIMDEVLNNLQKIKDFRVLSRTSVEKYRGSAKSTIPEVAKDLNVNYIVEGSGQKYGNSFRLRVQLIAAGNEKHLWAESYEQEIKDPGDIFKIQSRIAQSIADELKATITPEEKKLIEKKPTLNLTALDFFQRGNEEYQKGFISQFNTRESKEALVKAEVLYKKALRCDSTFASAYYGLAEVYYQKHFWETYLEENILDSVLILSNKALSYDDKLSDAYTARGQYYSALKKTDSALADYDRAIDLNPNDAFAYAGKGMLFTNIDAIKSLENFIKAASLHRGPLLPLLFQGIGFVFMNAGFMDKTIDYFHEALKLDGDSAQYYSALANIEFCKENYEKAIDFMSMTYRLAPDNNDVLGALGEFNMFAGRPEESLKYYKKWLEGGDTLSDLAFFASHRIGWAYLKNGDKEKARFYFNEEIRYCNRMKELGRVYGDDVRIFYDLAAVYAFLGDKKKAYESLRMRNDYQKRQNKSPGLYGLSLIRNDPLFDSIRNDPEFQQMLLDYQIRYQADHERVRKWLEENNML